MSIFLHFPSIFAHIYAKKAVSLHIEIKKQPYQRESPTQWRVVMKVYSELSLRDFEFWAGAKENALKFTPEQLDEVEQHLVEIYPDGIDETLINDIFWFYFDEICVWLGITEIL